MPSRGGNREPFWKVHFRAETGNPSGGCISGRKPGTLLEGAFPGGNREPYGRRIPGMKRRKIMTLEELQTIIADTLSCDKEEVTPEAALIDDLGADSLAVVELQMNIEEACGVKIPDEEIEHLKTVQDILDAVDKAKAA